MHELPTQPPEPQFRRLIYVEDLLALDPLRRVHMPHELNSPDPTAPRSGVKFGVLNLGSALVRIADGSELLLGDEGYHYLGNDLVASEEIEQRRWSTTQLSPYDHTQLDRLGIARRDFPVMGYEVPYYQGIYPRGYKQAGDGRRQYHAYRRMPLFSDMDPSSRGYLEKLFGGINLRNNRPGAVLTEVRIGEKRRMVPMGAALLRTMNIGDTVLDASDAQHFIENARSLG